MDCKSCKESRSPSSVPYVVHESALARAERTQKRLWVTVLLLIVLLVGSNAGWLLYESQFETVTQTVEQEADNGTNNFVGGDLIGTAESDNDSPQA